MEQDENIHNDQSAQQDGEQEQNAGEQTNLERQLAEAQEEAVTNLAGWQRSQADFENYKRREESKQAEILDFAKEVTVVKMLPTLDALHQGLKQAPQEVDQNWLQGINGTVAKLDKVLEEMGVKRIEAVGKPFDPNFHEAVREVSGEEDGVVVEELQTGFELNGKVVRPSQVVISKKE